MSILTTPADLAKGADPSPWTLSGDDLYTDSTSYLVGIGNTNPDTALHVTAASGGQLKLDDGTSACSFTFDDNSSDPFLLVDTALKLDANSKHITFLDKDGGSTDVGSVLNYTETASNQSLLKYNMNGSSFDENFVQIEMGASPGIALKRQEGTDVDAFFSIPSSGDALKLGTGTGSSTQIVTGNSARAEFTSAGDLKLLDGSNGLNIDVQSTTRRTLLGDVVAGDAGGNFNLEYNDSGSGTAQTFFSFGYGDTAHPYNARLSIKDAALPQLSLTDGTDTGTITAGSSAITFAHTPASYNLVIDATTNANLAFAKGGTIKAALRHHGATEGLLGVQTGMFKNNITPASAASLAISAPNGFGNVIACDATSNAITATLPAVADYQGVAIYVIDSKGQAASNNITVAVQTGEKMDGQVNGTSVLATNFNQGLFVCTADGWFEIK